jgi:hypothetical protein
MKTGEPPPAAGGTSVEAAAAVKTSPSSVASNKVRMYVDFFMAPPSAWPPMCLDDASTQGSPHSTLRVALATLFVQPARL